MTKTVNSVLDMNPLLSSFKEDVLSGLRQSQKQLHPKLFYDDKGSELFNQITTLSEYYLTRVEKEILFTNHTAISDLIGNESALIELGCGSEEKIKLILDSFNMEKQYIPIDISREALQKTADKISNIDPLLDVHPIRADYTQGLSFLSNYSIKKKIILFLGSTIGNFEEDDRNDFLRKLASQLNTNDGLIIGIDLRKSSTMLEAAYNDSSGITAAFNKNLLHRINQELNGNFQVNQFDHHAFFNEEKSRIEMHLLSLISQQVTVNGETFSFVAGETIHTENSYKFELDEFQKSLNKAGLHYKKVWTDRNHQFAVTYIKKLEG